MNLFLFMAPFAALYIAIGAASVGAQLKWTNAPLWGVGLRALFWPLAVVLDR